MTAKAPLLLAIDTTAAACAAALLCDQTCLRAQSEPMTRGHAERLLPLVGEMMAAAGRSHEDLDAIAVAVGPGNFTGIRIGVSAARGLAMSLGIPAIGVSTLEALTHGASGPVLALADARGGQVYSQMFVDGQAQAAPQMSDAGGIVVPAGTKIAGFDAAEVAKRLGLAAMDGPERPSAEHIGRVAMSRDWRGADRPAPLYIRAPDATPPAALMAQKN